MKAVILAGGMGSRLSEETVVKPKPMVEIGNRPILWHIMKIYSNYGINDFVICCGYKGYLIKEYFANYFLHMSDVTFHMSENRMEIHRCYSEPWNVTLVDTGEHTLTGGRLKRVAKYLIKEEYFCFTYGDGLADINIKEEIEFHKAHNRLATVAGVLPPGRYGALEIRGKQVLGFKEKPRGDGGLINGGFFVLSPKCIDLIEGDRSSWEGDILPELASLGELMVYEHKGFWHAMDTLRDKMYLESLWDSGKAPWKVWECPSQNSGSGKE
ncbi:MAG: glucose-1-phosphate cytidylyltransferase [candidate division WOR-3 bacterium]